MISERPYFLSDDKYFIISDKGYELTEEGLKNDKVVESFKEFNKQLKKYPWRVFTRHSFCFE